MLSVRGALVVLLIGCGGAAAGTDGRSDVGPDAAMSSDAGPDVGRVEDAGPPPGAGPLFIAAGVGGRRTISTDGAHWTHERLDVDSEHDHTPFLLRGGCYGDGVFMFVGGDQQGRSIVTRDGVSWEHDVHSDGEALGAFLGDCAFDGGTFVAAGGNGVRYRSEDEGASWQDVGAFVAGHFRRMAVGNGVFVAVGHTYDNAGMRASSTGGVNWDAPVMGGEAYGDIAFGNGVFLLQQGERILRSTDGRDWTDTGWAQPLRRLIFAGDRFLALYAGGYGETESGASWSHHESQVPDGQLAYGDGVFVASSWASFKSRSGSELWRGSAPNLAFNKADAPVGDSFNAIVFGWVLP